MNTETLKNAVKPIESTDLLCSSIPRKLPDGKENPEYWKWYRAKRKADGNPVKQSKRDPEYWSQYRVQRKEAGNPIPSVYRPESAKKFRASPKGKASVKRWNESEKGKAVRAKYMASKKGQRKRHETGEEYASRIIRELEEISLHNDQRNGAAENGPPQQ